MARLGADVDDAPGDGDGLARLLSFVSPYTGIVGGVHEALRAPDDARMTLVGCRMGSTEPTTGGPADLMAAGAGYRRDQAVAAAVGEALERYAGTCLPHRGVVLATAAELGAQAVEPERWALFGTDQHAQPGFPFEPFHDDTPVRWVEGWSIPDGNPVHVPLQLAYVVRAGMYAPGEAHVAYGSSNGMALAFDRDEAVLRGLLELVERDAVMLTWAWRLAPPRLDWHGDPALVAHAQRRFAPTDLPYHVLDLGLFSGVPTALALVPGAEARGGEPAATAADPVVWGIGAASAPTMREAWDKALREAFQTRASLRAELLSRPERQRLDASQVESPVDHIYFYVQPENHRLLDFLVGSEERRAVDDVPGVEGHDPAAQTEAIMRRLARHGVTAYAVDITPPDLADAGLHVVHVLSPELRPLDIRHEHRFRGGRRLYEAACDLGLRDRPLTPGELNPDPHPFP